MDSVTQMALGSAIGGAVLGRRLGWRAFAWGAAIGTLPDLDSFVPFGGPVADFTYHRGYTHALLVQTLISPALAIALNRWYREVGIGGVRWLAAVWGVLVTHALLDAVTIYGTQLWLPFSDYPVGLGSLFIIDPLYTLPLLVGIAGALRMRGQWQWARRWNATGLALASAYLVWSMIAQEWVEGRARLALAAQEIPAERLLVTPTPFNTLLWRVVAVGESAHWEGFYTVGSGRSPGFTRYPRRPELLDGVSHTWPVQRLQAFTKGFYTVNQINDAVVVTDLRMGQAGFYAFAFRVATRNNGRSLPIDARRYRYPDPPMPGALAALWDCALGRPTALIACGPGGVQGGLDSVRPPGNRP
jgi:inner membrane protein